MNIGISNWHIEFSTSSKCCFDRTKMLVLPSFQLATQLHSQNTNETEFINEI